MSEKKAMCTFRVPLHIEPWQKDKINRNMEIANKVYNTTVKQIRTIYFEYSKTKQFRADNNRLAEIYSMLDQSNAEGYIALQKDLKSKLKEKGLSAESKEDLRRQIDEISDRIDQCKAEQKEIFNKRNSDYKELGLTKFGVGHMVLANARHFKNNIPSEVVSNSLTNPIWASLEKFLFQKGNSLHFRKFDDTTLLLSCNKSGMKLKEDERGRYLWFSNNTRPKAKVMKIYLYPCDSYYLSDLISRELVQVGIQRVREKTDWHYYFYAIAQGDAPIVLDDNGNPRHKVGTGVVTMCLWRNRLAVTSETEVKQFNLLPKKHQAMYEEICELDRRITELRIRNNPDNYNEDGTIKKGIYVDGKRTRLEWHDSRKYKELVYRRYELFRKLREYKKILYHEIYYQLMEMGDTFYYSSPSSNLTHKKDYSEEEQQPTNAEYRKKKERRRSIQVTSPSMFFRSFDEKLTQYGLETVHKVKVSDDMYWYRHDKDCCDKDSFMDDKVQLFNATYPHTLYRAFLLRFYDDNCYDLDAIRSAWTYYEPLLKNGGYIPVREE